MQDWFASTFMHIFDAENQNNKKLYNIDWWNDKKFNLISNLWKNNVKLKSKIDREIECSGNYRIQFLLEIEKYESMMCNKWFLWFK